MSKNILYIGLNGYAGSGKDTVAKILKVILNNFNLSIDECKSIFNVHYKNPMVSATFHDKQMGDSRVLCIAYADQLKTICSTIFGIPLERFYMNKSNAWICINDKFQYTEIRPEHTVTAGEYYYNISSYQQSDVNVWMSLREILVYVGTYVCQSEINRSIFVNIVRNKIQEEKRMNPNLEYVIVTDNRFQHEIDYLHEVNAITMTIERDGIQQLDNIAEHDLDDETGYDYVIDNSGSYDYLFEQVYNIVHDNIIFQNYTINLPTRDNVNNYLRKISDTEFMLCAPIGLQKAYHAADGTFSMIDPVGGPSICVDELLFEGKHVNTITMNDDGEHQQYIITFCDELDE